MTYVDAADVCECRHVGLVHLLKDVVRGGVKVRIRRTCSHMDEAGPCGCVEFRPLTEGVERLG